MENFTTYYNDGRISQFLDDNSRIDYQGGTMTYYFGGSTATSTDGSYIYLSPEEGMIEWKNYGAVSPTWTINPYNGFYMKDAPLTIDGTTTKVEVSSNMIAFEGGGDTKWLMPQSISGDSFSYLPTAGGVLATEDYVDTAISEAGGSAPYKSIVLNAMTTYEEWDNNSYSLEIGSTYVISYLEPGDDFSNVGYVSEEVPFVATGTTPTTWTNGTYLNRYGILINELQNDTEDSFTYTFDYDSYQGIDIIGTEDTFTLSKIWVLGANVSWARTDVNSITIENTVIYDITYGTEPYPTSIEIRIYP